MVVGGYCRLLQAMAARVDVRLTSPVTLVEDLDNDTVRVTTAAGTYNVPGPFRFPSPFVSQASGGPVPACSPVIDTCKTPGACLSWILQMYMKCDCISWRALPKTCLRHHIPLFLDMGGPPIQRVDLHIQEEGSAGAGATWCMDEPVPVEEACVQQGLADLQSELVLVLNLRTCPS